MTVAQGYALVVLALAALLAYVGSRHAARGDIADGALGGITALGLIGLALVVHSPL